MTKTTIYALLGFAILCMFTQCTSDGKTSERPQNNSSTAGDSTVKFNAPAVGWSFKYPADWKVVKKNEIKSGKRLI